MNVYTEIAATIGAQTEVAAQTMQQRPAQRRLSGMSGATELLTLSGPRRVNALRPGDRVLTMDHGYQPVRWTGRISWPARLQPIRIRKGALGNGLPTRDLIVAPNQGLLVQSRIIERMFDATEVLVCARNMLEVEGIDPALGAAAQDGAEWLLLFDEHELIFAHGAPTESFHLGSAGTEDLPPLFKDAICAALRSGPDAFETARPARAYAPDKRALRLAKRHNDNQQAFVQTRTAQ